MAVPEPERLMTFDGHVADNRHDSVPGPRPGRIQGRASGSLRGPQQRRHRKTGKREIPTNLRNALIVLTIMLILLLTLQSPVCCDRIIASESTLPPATEQALHTAPIPLSHKQSLPKKNDGFMAAATAVVDAGIKQMDAEATEVTGSNVKASLALQITATAKAEVPESLSSGIEAIKTDAASTLTEVSPSGFVKLAVTGEVLDDDAASWECVEDKQRKLTWEVKKNNGGMRDKDHSYSWLGEFNGEKYGVGNGGRCRGGISCDTLSYARAMNEQGLCGYSDWRLPTKEELETLVEYSANPEQPTIDTTYFPEAIPSWYWTASEHPGREHYAWYVLFRNGVALNDLKERPKHIRLVRGQTPER